MEANVVKLDLNITKKKKVVKTKSVHKLQSVKGQQHSLRNKARKLRRKIRKYHKLLPDHLKRTKLKKVCKRVEVFDMAGCGVEQNFEPAITDVAEWNNLHQIAYWKSRAISLEYENKMLYQHIKEVHSREIREYAKTKNDENVEEIQSQFSEKANIGKGNRVVLTEESEEEQMKYLPPSAPVGEAEKERNKVLYGSMAPKISGMEAAAQLNYNYQVENNVPYWPNIPFKL